MIIEKHELYKIVRPENGKLLKDTEGIYNILYLPLKMEDDKISQKFTEIDENDFEIKVEADSGIYSKLSIRRTCRELNLENKLNSILESNETFRNDWNDSTQINLNDEILIEALKQGTFTTDEIESIKQHLAG